MSVDTVRAEDVSTAQSKPPPRRGNFRVLVFNDHPVFRASLMWKLGEDSGLEITTEAATVEEAVSSCAIYRPDVVLADLRIGDGNSEGVELIQALTHNLPHVPVVVYSDFYSSGYVRQIKSAGATGFLLKSAGAERIIAALHRVAQGKSTFPARSQAA